MNTFLHRLYNKEPHWHPFLYQIDWRLYNGSSPNEGRLQYRPVNGEWGSACVTIIGYRSIYITYARIVCEILGFQKIMSYYEFSSPHLFGTSQGRTYDVIIRNGTLYMKRNNTCYHDQIRLRSFRCTSGKFLYIKFNYHRPIPGHVCDQKTGKFHFEWLQFLVQTCYQQNFD